MKKTTSSRVWMTQLALIVLIGLVGCQTAYYKVWETFGKEKRDLLKDSVEDVHDDQEKASKEFQDALTRLRQLYDINGGELEAYYDNIKADYDECESRSKAVHERIDQMDRIANDLFSEWDGEIEEITNPRLAMDSRRKLGETKRNYATLKRSVDSAASRMDKVLPKLHDQVLYLKHNLNAQAIGSLRGEADSIILEIGTLIDEMNKSISEAESFSKTL